MLKLTPLDSSVFTRGAAATKSLHGELHAYRVGLLSGILALTYKMQLEPCIIAGLYHDIARINDKSDHGHGGRSAARALSLGLIPNSLPAESITQAIVSHDLSAKREDPCSRILKTADALDRFRLPKTRWWPDIGLMPITPSTNLLALAFILVIASESFALEQSYTPKRSIENAVHLITSRGLG